MKNTNRIATLTTALILSLCASHAFAQSTAKPASKAPSAKRSGPGDRVMSKDELRTCMALKDSNDRGAADLSSRQEQMSKERAELANAPATAGPDPKVEVDPFLKAAQEADAKVREHAKSVQDWNERMGEFEAKSKDMRNADRRRMVLKQEQLALKAAEGPLVATQRDAIAAYERAVADYNKKIQSGGAGGANVNTRNADWNKRNAELAQVEDRLNASRLKWTNECGNRRFREDDETAIKAGK